MGKKKNESGERRKYKGTGNRKRMYSKVRVTEDESYFLRRRLFGMLLK
jgi:hypothetical protein